MHVLYQDQIVTTKFMVWQFIEKFLTGPGWLLQGTLGYISGEKACGVFGEGSKADVTSFAIYAVFYDMIQNEKQIQMDIFPETLC